MFKYPQNKPVTPKPIVPKAPTKAPAYEPTAVPSEWVDTAAQAPAEVTSDYGFGDPVGSTGAFPTGAYTPSSVAAVTRNVLNSDVSVEGILRFTDDLLVDGSVVGEISSDGVLTVGANAIIQAGDKNKVAVRTKSAIIQGRVTGDVEVTDRVELTSSAVLIGNVKASKISIQEGASFVGYCEVGSVGSVPAPKKPAKGGKTDGDNLLG